MHSLAMNRDDFVSRRGTAPALGPGSLVARLVMGLAFLALALLAGPVRAHPAPFSYLDIHVGENRTEGVLVVHVIDVAHELGLQSPEQLLDPRQLAQRERTLFALLGPRMTLRAQAPLPLHWRGVSAHRDRDALELRFDAPPVTGGKLTVDADIFPYDANHQSFVNVYEGPALKRQWILARDSAEARTHYLGTAAGTLAVVRTFVASGIHHILIGPDHILFLVGLLLLGGSWGALVRIVTAFTLGHSVTLSLAALGIVDPPAWIIEPAIALSIVVVGADNLMRGEGRDMRAWVALAFGLIHGFGFAAVLRAFGLPQEALLWSLLSFNIGVELGQLAIVIVVASVLRFIWQRKPEMAKRVAQAGSVIVILAGIYWFIERIAFPGGM